LCRSDPITYAGAQLGPKLPISGCAPLDRLRAMIETISQKYWKNVPIFNLNLMRPKDMTANAAYAKSLAAFADSRLNLPRSDPSGRDAFLTNITLSRRFVRVDLPLYCDPHLIACLTSATHFSSLQLQTHCHCQFTNLTYTTSYGKTRLSTRRFVPCILRAVHSANAIILPSAPCETSWVTTRNVL